METRSIKIEDIVRLPEIQIRTRISKPTVDAYVEAMKEGVKFDALDAFLHADMVDGAEVERVILADGWHRLLAYEERGIKSVEVNIHECEEGQEIAAAIEFSCERNGKHGLPLSRADKRNAIVKILENPTLRRKGDRPISKMVGVSPQLVKDVRYEMANADAAVEVAEHRRRKAKKKVAAEPEAPVAHDEHDERVKTFEKWVDDGFIEWPDVVKAFETGSHIPFRMPKTPHKIVIVRDGKRANLLVNKVSVVRKEGVQLLVVEVVSTKEIKK